MKKYILILFLLEVLSCSDQHEPARLIPEEIYCVMDGTTISGANIYCDLFKGNNYHDLGFSCIEDYNNSVKTVSTYEDFYFILEIEHDNPMYQFYDKDREQMLQSELYSYLHSKAEIVRDNLKYHSNNGDESGFGLDSFLTAYINGEVEITCDKTLFGLPPGTNISNHLKILYNYTCQPFGIKAPYSIVHCKDIENSLQKSVFSDQAWLRYKYCFCFDDKPDEEYDELSFHIKLPIIKEFASHYIASLINGSSSQLQYVEVVYEADTKIRFL